MLAVYLDFPRPAAEGEVLAGIMAGGEMLLETTGRLFITDKQTRTSVYTSRTARFEDGKIWYWTSDEFAGIPT
jgi:hypothetical protein